MSIDLNLYSQFVEGVTSATSNDTGNLISRLNSLQTSHPDINFSLLLTGAMGMNGEAGEFSEYIKKIMFHGKDLTPELLVLLKKELGDQIWYWTNSCRALGVDPNEIIADNKDKLLSRYPGGVFSIEKSENRKATDL